MNIIKKLVIGSSLAAGVSYAYWCLLSRERLVQFAFWCVLWLLLARTRIGAKVKSTCGCIYRIIEEHSRLVLLGVLGIAILLRVGVLAWVPHDILDSEKLVSDWMILYHAGRDFAHGLWPINKSWVTTIYHAVMIWGFGENLLSLYVSNNLLYLLSGWIAYKIGKMLFGNVAGVFAAASVVWSPVFLFHSLRPATEHCYVLLALSCLYFATRSVFSRGLKYSIVWFFLSGASVWAAAWTRGEGVILFVIPMWILVFNFVEKNWTGLFAHSIVFLSVIGLGMILGWSVNMQTNGARTFLCSNDNYWPRLFGSNKETGGHWNREDKIMIYNRYVQDHPESGWDFIEGTNLPSRIQARCPQELVPYIKDEINKRWNGMGMGAKVRFMLKKSQVWRDDCNFVVLRSFPKGQGKIMAFLPTVLLLLSLVAFTRPSAKVSANFFIFSVVWVMMANVVILCLSEVMPRYTFLFHCFWGVVASGCLGLHPKEKGLDAG